MSQRAPIMTDAGKPYPHLLAPLRIGRHILKNRVIMGSMHTRLEQAERSVERRVAFYEERAKNAVALIITAGYSPNLEGRLEGDAQVFDSAEQLPDHLPVTAAVHAHGSKMLLQILHAGRYAKHDHLVGPSAIASPINRRMPRALSEADVERTIADFSRTAELAAEAGYDGVEIMGSEGYLLNQFCALRTNQRGDQWGGSLENRCALPLEIIRRVRARTGPDFLIAYRISAVDLVDQGLNGDEIGYLARNAQFAGADLLSTGIGWHESPVPTIAYHVPRAAWSFATARLKAAVTIPVIAANRINTPEVAEGILARGAADLVSLARPLLADPEFVTKAAAGRPGEINTCIACNQACLDYIFRDQTASCLVNPRAAREIEFDTSPAQKSKHLGVVGAGPAGVAFAIQAAARGHRVVLFEAASEIGGQLNLASRIPGKGEFLELLRYFRVQLARHAVEVRLRAHVTAASLLAEGFEHVVVATGSVARSLDLAHVDIGKIATYTEIISGARKAGPRVAIIGTGGIGHDVAELLTSTNEPQTAAQFFAEWGVDPTLSSPGALRKPHLSPPARFVQMFQRSQTRPGARLGSSTGWILRKKLLARGVEVISGCEYLRIDQLGLHYKAGGHVRLANVDTVVTCAGQEPGTELPSALTEARVSFDVIGGARAASELDATRAISEGVRLAFAI